ncbi:MAG: aminopeptidase P family protein [Spirochaetaceae bacterium]
MNITERVAALRGEMEKEGLDAYIIYGTDPHISEYVAPPWRDREWISGFTGSAGTVAVFADDAVLCTDPRYHLQAARELEGSPFRLIKEGLSGSPSFAETLGNVLGAENGRGKSKKTNGQRGARKRKSANDGTGIVGSKVAAACASTLSLAAKRALQKELAPYGVDFTTTGDLIDRIWEDRPELPKEWIYQHDASYTGLSRRAKISLVREALFRRVKSRRQGAYQLISSLDDIAWLFNLRGSDIAYNPLFISYALVGGEKTFLYADKEKFSEDLAGLLEDEGIALRPYEGIYSDIRKLPPGSSVVLSPEKTNCAVASAIPEKCRVLEHQDITTHLKARKNEVECGGIREAMRKDGVAMVRFLSWLSHAWERGGESEISLAVQLRDFRSQMPGFVGESFAAIVAFRDHGAVMHYSATEDTVYPVEGEGLLLIDSGGHYLEGTTDITRTVPFGEISEQQRSDYTAVLKAHISLSSTTFPEGTKGIQLDAVTRKPMWDLGLNYSHGTGHGVGFFLNVHEGPQKISYRDADAALEPGMVNSNEPGIYREGEYGIRTENVILVKEAFTTPFGRFYGFETLTLCPYERALIETGMLSRREREWIDAYHKRVFETLVPELNETERRWLEEKTAPL